MFRHALMLTVLLAGAPFVHAAEDAASAPAAAAAAPMSEGEIKKIDTAAGKLTIKHGPLENLGMEPMTMVFPSPGSGNARQSAGWQQSALCRREGEWCVDRDRIGRAITRRRAPVGCPLRQCRGRG